MSASAKTVIEQRLRVFRRFMFLSLGNSHVDDRGADGPPKCNTNCCKLRNACLPTAVPLPVIGGLRPVPRTGRRRAYTTSPCAGRGRGVAEPIRFPAVTDLEGKRAC